MKTKLASAMAAVLVLATACGSGAQDGLEDAAPDAPAPLEFSATQLDGQPFEGEGLRGTDTVLWFWAPWCTSCRAEAPGVVEAAAEFEGSVEVIGVPGRGSTDEMADFDFRNAAEDPDPDALDKAARAIRAALRALGHGVHVPD